jgi:hypothetical protein
MFPLKSFGNNNPKIISLIGNQNQQSNNSNSFIEGPTGPSGKDGDRFCTKTIRPTLIDTTANSLLVLHVEPGLAYISGNSVIVAEVADNLTSELNTFEGTIHYYSQNSGQLIIKDITNIHGVFGEKECFYYVNLDGVDGAPGERGQDGPTGPQGPTSVSTKSTILELIDNSVIIPPQSNPISYYKLNLNNSDELKNIFDNLTNNQTAIILINLNDLSINNSTTAFIFPILNININMNYNSVISLNDITPFAIFKLYNIENLLFGECITYFKNTYYVYV